MADIDRLFLFSSESGETGTGINSVDGFVQALEYAFYSTAYAPLSMTHTPLMNELRRVTIYDALENNLLYESALDALAAQWSLPGWEYVGKYNVTTTVADRKNEVLKKTTALMRSIGTPFAIVRILETFGYTNVSVTENVAIDILYDGTFDYDGKVNYFGTLENQLFSVALESDHDISQVDLDEQNMIVDLVNYYKKERVELYQLIITEPSNPGGRTVQIW